MKIQISLCGKVVNNKKHRYNLPVSKKHSPEIKELLAQLKDVRASIKAIGRHIAKGNEFIHIRIGYKKDTPIKTLQKQEQKIISKLHALGLDVNLFKG
jgi:hypothetical protein